MRTAWPLATAVVLLAGCAAAPPPEDFLLEDPGGDASPSFDIVRANLTELSGSLVVRVDLKNYADGLPLVEARITSTAGVHFVRLVPDPERPTLPKLRAEAGRYADGAYHEAAEACWMPSFPTDPDSEGPWLVFLELLHNRTGLNAGGRVTALALQTSGLNGSVEDRAEARGAFALVGGPNPYQDRSPSCPLIQERERLRGA